MADVSLATFHLFDKENIGSGTQGTQVAVVVVRRCGGCGCRGCAWRGCRCGGWGVRRLLRTLGAMPLVVS
jgi:hypothetical protein